MSIQREIKFRAWDKLAKKMYAEVDSDFGKGEKGRTHEIELMQFTGFKDKNGKKIFEGDIINYIIPRKKGISVFANRYRVDFEDGRFIGIGDSRIGSKVELLKITNEKFEVIGNIYENSNLLK